VIGLLAQRFWRLAAERTRSEEGVGLGLSIVAAMSPPTMARFCL
jgi:signal transduction histidine kinase